VSHRRYHLLAVLIMSLAAPLNMHGWLTLERIPLGDFQGAASSVEYLVEALRRHGWVPAWNPKWFAGTAHFSGVFHYVVTVPFALLAGVLRGPQLMIGVAKIGAGIGVYAIFARLLHAPLAGLVAGYAYAFGTPSNYVHSTGLDQAISSALLPAIFIASVELVRCRQPKWAVILGVLVACELGHNYAYVTASLTPVMLGLVLALRPWRTTSDADRLTDVALVKRWGGLVALAALVCLPFAASQVAWLAADLRHHTLHDPAHVAWAVEVFIEHTPFLYLNRNGWLGPWLAAHHPPEMPLYADDPVMNTRHYLGIVAMAVAAIGWMWARRQYSLRRWYQLFGLLFVVQYWLSLGPRTVLWQIGRSFGWPESADAGLRRALEIGALVALGWAIALARRPSPKRRPFRIELALGVALLVFMISHSLFAMGRQVIPLWRGLRSPGHFFDLAPFSFYCMVGVGAAGLGQALSTRRMLGNALGVALLALVALDFWPSVQFFHRGRPVQPVQGFRQVMAQLPAEEGPLRVALPETSPSAFGAATLVISGAAVDGAWNWLPWQAGKHWPTYLGAAMAWLEAEPSGEGGERLRSLGYVLGGIARLKYFLEELDGHADLELGPPWQVRAENARFRLWARPDVMPMSYGVRSHLLLLGEDDTATAVAVAAAVDRSAVILATPDEAGEPDPELIGTATAVLCVGRAGAAGGPCRRVRQAYPGKALIAASEVGRPEVWGRIERSPGVAVRYARPHPEHIVLDADAGDQPAFLFVGESYHPWWQARVDGTPARVLRAQMAFMAVGIGPGAHRVDLVLHRPALVAAADALTALAWAALVLAGLVWCRRAVVARR